MRTSAQSHTAPSSWATAVSVLFEACVATAADCREAAAWSADRVELCVDLEWDGCTPPLALAAECVAIGIPVIAMVRPRAGSFVCQPAEIDGMCRDMAELAALGVAGFATGALASDDTVDASATASLVAAAAGLPVTFHRAFDRVPDRDEAVETLVALGVRRVLTSGGASRAEDGLAALRRLTDRALGRIEVIAAGGIRPHNVERIVAGSMVPAVHARWSGWRGGSGRRTRQRG